MPDITMCSNSTCPHTKACYRFRAEPNEWHQSYAYFSPNEKDAFKSCDHFMMIAGRAAFRPSKERLEEIVNLGNELLEKTDEQLLGDREQKLAAKEE